MVGVTGISEKLAAEKVLVPCKFLIQSLLGLDASTRFGSAAVLVIMTHVSKLTD